MPKKTSRQPDTEAARPARRVVRAAGDKARRQRQAERHARTLRVLELIMGRGRYKADDIARELQCSPQTVYRTLRVLEAARVPWYFDRDANCYRVQDSFWFPQLNLTDDELMGLVVASAVSAAPGIRAGEGVRPTLRKLADTADGRRAALMEDVQRLVEIRDIHMADHSRCQEAIRTIQSALLRGKQVAGQYRSPYEQKPVGLTLHPYRLCLARQAWYLVGRPSDADHPKTYRVARFQSLRTLPDDADMPVDFDLKVYFGNAWGVYRGDRTYDVEVAFTREAAPLVIETEWHPTQKVQRRKDGTATLLFRVDGLDEIVWWILGWSGRAKVVRPPELRELVIAKLQDALKLHGE